MQQLRRPFSPTTPSPSQRHSRTAHHKVVLLLPLLPQRHAQPGRQAWQTVILGLAVLQSLQASGAGGASSAHPHCGEVKASCTCAVPNGSAARQARQQPGVERTCSVAQAPSRASCTRRSRNMCCHSAPYLLITCAGQAQRQLTTHPSPGRCHLQRAHRKAVPKYVRVHVLQQLLMNTRPQIPYTQLPPRAETAAAVATPQRTR